jgi:LysR family cyn operon transcriptional activator
LPNREFASRRLLDEQLRTLQIEPAIAVEMNDIDSLLEIVRLGTGATVLTRRAVNDPKGLVLVGITHPRMTRTGALLWHRDSHRTAASRAFANVIQTVAVAL